MILRYAALSLLLSATVAVAQPNLTVTFDPGETDAQAAAGVSFDVGVRACNTGSGTVDDPRVGYYLSTDSVFDPGDAFIGFDVTQDLDGGECDDEPDNLAVPGNQPPGRYQLLAVADDLGAVAESDETDNTVARPFTVTEGSGEVPDVRVSSSTNLFRLTRGATYSYECSAFNQGNGEGSVTMLVYFSEDAELSSDDAFLGSEGPENLNPGDGEQFEVENVTIPVVPYGDYFLLCVAQVPGDADLSNNVGSRPVRLVYVEGTAETSLDFGTTEVGTPVTRLVTLSNRASSSEPLTVSASILERSGQFEMPNDGVSYTLAPGESVQFSVTFTAIYPGEWDDQVYYSSDATEGTLRTDLTGVAVHAGDAASVPSPEAFSVTVPPGEAVTEILKIQNPGTTPLTFDLYSSDDDIPCIGGIFECGYQLRGDGGPNDFGYIWRDSDEAGGPAFGWIEIRESGTPITERNQEVMLPFSFPFYGTGYDRVYVHNHGHVSFEYQSSTGCSGQCSIPDRSPPNNVLMAYYGGFSASSDSDLPGEMYTQDLGDGRFVVQFSDMRHRFEDGKTFQVILHEDGRVLYQYLRMPLDTPSGDVMPARIGLENENATDPLRIADWSNYQGYAHDELAIAITPTLPIIGGLDPSSGTVPPGSSLDVAVTFQSSALRGGTVYSDSVLVRSNAVTGYERWVPVSLTVGSAVAAEDVVPAVLSLDAPFPNPASQTAMILYAVPSSQRTRLAVYDVLGREVAVLSDGERASGAHESTLDTSTLAPGVYVVRLTAGAERRTRTLTVAR